MPLAWVAPAGIAGVGFVVATGLASQVTGQLRGLHRDLDRFSELRPALVALRQASDQARRNAQTLHSH